MKKFPSNPQIFPLINLFHNNLRAMADLRNWPPACTHARTAHLPEQALRPLAQISLKISRLPRSTNKNFSWQWIKVNMYSLYTNFYSILIKPTKLTLANLRLRHCEQIQRFSLATKWMGVFCTGSRVPVFCDFYYKLVQFFEWINNVKLIFSNS
jgi:hypothetical protein